MSFDIQKLVRSHIADLQPYSSARDEFDPVEGEVVDLDANENPFDNGVKPLFRSTTTKIKRSHRSAERVSWQVNCFLVMEVTRFWT